MNSRIPLRAAAVPLSVDAPLSHGTRVLLAWAEWNRKHDCGYATRIGVFVCGDLRRVLHEYGPACCAVLELASAGPKIRDFREWLQPFEVAAAKLKDRGWVMVSDSRPVVSHAQ